MSVPSSPNLIGLIAAHAIKPGRDPAENRLTAGLIAVLSKVPELSVTLLNRCVTDDGLDRAVTVRREFPIGGQQGRVDLVLETGRDAQARQVWVEVKLASPLSGPGQLENYSRRLASSSAAVRRLVLLAPAAAAQKFPDVPPLADLPDGSPGPGFLAWQEVYELIAAWRSGREEATVDHWLTGQLLDYMEEAGLRPTGALTEAHVDVLKAQGHAEETLHAIVLEAAELLEVVWQPPRRPREIADKWQGNYPAGAPNAPDGAWGKESTFYWWVDEGEFWAGVYFSTSDLSSRDAFDVWAADMQAADGRWTLEADGTRALNLSQSGSLQELVDVGEPHAQAQMLCNRFLGIFQSLAAAGPPTALPPTA